MKKYLPIILTALAALAPVFSGAVQAYYGSHPQAVALIAGVWAIIKYLLPSPIASK